PLPKVVKQLIEVDFPDVFPSELPNGLPLDRGDSVKFHAWECSRILPTSLFIHRTLVVNCSSSQSHYVVIWVAYGAGPFINVAYARSIKTTFRLLDLPFPTHT